MLPKKIVSKDIALQKAKSFCVYQERSHGEVRDKIYGLGVQKKDVEDIITLLIAENYLNEERFAIQYAGGKFRIKSWGKIRIAYELKQKGISPYCIKKALEPITETDYMNTLTRCASAKAAQLASETKVHRRLKMQAYLVQKGFEPHLVFDVIKNLESG